MPVPSTAEDVSAAAVWGYPPMLMNVTTGSPGAADAGADPMSSVAATSTDVAVTAFTVARRLVDVVRALVRI